MSKQIFGDINGIYMVGQIQNPLNSNMPGSPNTPIDSLVDYKLNSLGYRSDEFTKDHEGKHILFSGCSVTYGIGLSEEEIWAKRLYNKIKENEPVSGFYNLGVTGMGTLEIVINIYKYIKNFGNPNAIFINFPDPSRFYTYDMENHMWMYGNFSGELPSHAHGLFNVIPMLYYQHLFMLEMYCKSNNILLSYLTWDTESKLIDQSDLVDFQRPKKEEIAVKCLNYIIQNQEDKHAINARDGLHQGNAFHYAWTEILYNDYITKMEKNEY